MAPERHSPYRPPVESSDNHPTPRCLSDDTLVALIVTVIVLQLANMLGFLLVYLS